MNIQAIDTILSSTDVVNILGSYLDSELTLERQVYILQQTLQVCYFHLRRLSTYITKFSGISAAIRDELHWLPIRKRIEFKIILFKRHCLVGSASESFDGAVSFCQFSSQSTKPPGSFPWRLCRSSISSPNIRSPSFCCLGPSAFELAAIGC